MLKRSLSAEETREVRQRCGQVAERVLEAASGSVKRAAESASHESKRPRCGNVAAESSDSPALAEAAEAARLARMFIRGAEYVRTQVLPELLRQQADEFLIQLNRERNWWATSLDSQMRAQAMHAMLPSGKAAF